MRLAQSVILGDHTDRPRCWVDDIIKRPHPPQPKPMKRFWKTIFLALIIVGGLWILLNQGRIQEAGGLTAYLKQSFNQLSQNSIQMPGWSTDDPSQSQFGSRWQQTDFRSASASDQTDLRQRRPWGGDRRINGGLNAGGVNKPFHPILAMPPRLPNTIRIASFKLIAGAQPESDSQATHVLTHLCSQFDIVALQETNSRSDAWLNQIGSNVAAATNGGVKFQVLTDRAKIETGQPQFAILFNSNTLDLDQSQWYSVNDPDHLLARAPLVGWFRAKNVPLDEAFTFTLANIQLDNHRPDLELGYIGELFRAIRNDGRGEDDVIIVGNFNAGDRGLSPLRKRAGLNWVVFDTPTSTDKTNQFDNLVFSQNATVEFTGQGGVLDFLAAYNLRYDQAIAISDHMPIWAEFSTIEGNEAR